MRDGQDEQEINDDAFPEKKGDMTIKRKKIQFFKFWNKLPLRQAWKNYINAGAASENLNTLYIAIQIFDQANEQFILGQIQKLDKKAAKIGQKNEFMEKLYAKPV